VTCRTKFGLRKPGFLGYLAVKTAWSYSLWFWRNTSVWQTDGVGQTDIALIDITRSAQLR